MVHNIGEFQNSTFDIFIPLMQRVVLTRILWLFQDGFSYNLTVNVQIFMFESVLKISEHVEICNACWKHIEEECWKL